MTTFPVFVLFLLYACRGKQRFLLTDITKLLPRPPFFLLFCFTLVWMLNLISGFNLLFVYLLPLFFSNLFSDCSLTVSVFKSVAARSRSYLLDCLFLADSFITRFFLTAYQQFRMSHIVHCGLSFESSFVLPHGLLLTLAHH